MQNKPLLSILGVSGYTPQELALSNDIQFPSLDELDKAYKQRARIVHPDKNRSPTAQQDFQELSSVWDWLKQPLNYTTYKDATIASARQYKKQIISNTQNYNNNYNNNNNNNNNNSHHAGGGRDIYLGSTQDVADAMRQTSQYIQSLRQTYSESTSIHSTSSSRSQQQTSSVQNSRQQQSQTEEKNEYNTLYIKAKPITTSNSSRIHYQSSAVGTLGHIRSCFAQYGYIKEITPLHSAQSTNSQYAQQQLSEDMCFLIHFAPNNSIKSIFNNLKQKIDEYFIYRFDIYLKEKHRFLDPAASSRNSLNNSNNNNQQLQHIRSAGRNTHQTHITRKIIYPQSSAITIQSSDLNPFDNNNTNDNNYSHQDKYNNNEYNNKMTENNNNSHQQLNNNNNSSHLDFQPYHVSRIALQYTEDVVNSLMSTNNTQTKLTDDKIASFFYELPRASIQ